MYVVELLSTPQASRGPIGMAGVRQELQPETPSGKVDGVPAWSLVAAFARPDGGFVITY
jgi:hypothetical protein